MNTKCDEFENRLGDLLAGALPPWDLRAAAEHSAGCARCRRLLDVAQGKTDLLPAGAERELARGILQKTSGYACDRAREQICDFVDGGLHCGDAQILAIHVENCEDCAGLVRLLRELSTALPQMADVDPGPLFARQVLAATGRRERPKAERRDVFADWWHSMVRRPRFAWEAAYVTTLLLVLVAGNPALMSMAASAPLESVRGRTRIVWTTATEELAGLSSAATSRAAEAAGRLSQKVAGNPLQPGDSASRLWQRGRRLAADTASFNSVRVKRWAADALQVLQKPWKSLGLDRTFS